MRKLLFAVLVLVSAVVLSSCVFLPPGGVIFDDDNRQADARMGQVVDAVNGGDAAALKALFSDRALEQATDIDQGLEYLLSFFPNGGLTWERDALSSEVDVSASGKTELLRVFYKVSADGKYFWLYFADFTVNETIDPENVGLYGLGVTPWTKSRQTGASRPFQLWATGIQMDKNGENGYPGIYVPEQ